MGNVTFVMINHTLIISGAINRNCIISRLPVSFNFCQRIALYLLFIFRLHHSFGDTQFGIKSIYIWILLICIIVFGLSATAYFFVVIVTANNPCASNLAFEAGAPALAQDVMFNMLLSVLFISRLWKTVSLQMNFSSCQDLELAKLKKARAGYKFYYMMFKLTLLFLLAVIMFFFIGLAAAFTSIDSVASNYLLYLNFQF